MPEELSNEVGERIARLGAARGWSGRELARRAGMPTASANKKLTGVSVITLDDLEAFGRALEMDPRKLLSP